MPPALDRLLASPSALSLLRSLVNAPELPPAYTTAAKCCTWIASRRIHSDHRKPSSKKQWRRWQDATQEITNRDNVRRVLEAEGTADTHLQALDTLDHDALGEETEQRGTAATWAATLARRERLHRMPGIRAVWSSLNYRGFRLPTDETPDAEFLWGTFIKNPRLVEEVIDHAAKLVQETSNTYPRLYHLVMTYWLHREPQNALNHHHRMVMKLNLRNLPLRELIRSGRTTFDLAAWEALLDIYRTSNERNLYDETVLPLIEKETPIMARRWHNLCIFRGDVPSESAASNPVVQIFTAEASTVSNTTRHFETEITAKQPKQADRYNQELMRRLLGRDTAPVRFEDSFCARMFATRTFQPTSIIQGLAMVGVNELGPQAVLAMASRTQPIEELPNRFNELKAAGIALQGCVFSLALEKFAMENKWQLVCSMLDSDQHPDVVGDAEVQQTLLEHYLDQKDFVQAQRTLAILTLFHKDSSDESWNLLLQTYIKLSGPQHVMEVLEDMRSRDITLTYESIRAIRSLLRRRQRGHHPIADPTKNYDDLRFVTRAFMTVLESSVGFIAPRTWTEIVRRFGMLGRFKELRRLLFWLLCWYAPRIYPRYADLPKSPFLEAANAKFRSVRSQPDHPSYAHWMATQDEDSLDRLRLLFPPSLLQGLIVWGFRGGLLPNANLEQSMLGFPFEKHHYRERLLESQALQRHHWSAGLRLVVQLRDNGIEVPRHTVVKTLQGLFIVMFGRGTSKKEENRVMEMVNNISYTTYINEVNQIWGSPLFQDPQLLEQGIPYEEMWHPRMRRRIDRKGSISATPALGPGEREQSGEKMIQSKDNATEKSGISAHEELQEELSGMTDRQASISVAPIAKLYEGEQKREQKTIRKKKATKQSAISALEALQKESSGDKGV